MEITEPPGCLQCDGLWNVQSGTDASALVEWLLQHMLLSNFLLCLPQQF